MSEIKKEDYVVCRYQGASGDVIAGHVLKIRAGKVYMKNLLTGADSVRALDIVNRRNITVPRDVALSIAEIFHSSEDKQKARKAAVDAADKVKEDHEKELAAKGGDGKDQETKVKKMKAKKPVAAKVANDTNGHAEAPKRRGRPPGAKNKPKKAAAVANGATTIQVQVSAGGKVLINESYALKA